jgi:hypothetical protein
VVESTALRAKIGELFTGPPGAYVVAYCPAIQILREGAHHVLPVRIGETDALALVLVLNPDVLAAVEEGLS